ncbi:triose-phosphate isomerase [Ruminococcus sp. AF18-22]|jgi:triosephosphate isomerase|nr:triose-phosphate isomerase [Ruminococcus sp. AF18-22]
MKERIKAPFFEIGIKNYLYGDDVLSLACAADKAAQEYDVDVLFITPYTEIRRVAEHTKRLIVLAPYMDLLKPGRGMADVLPEALAAAGAKGVVLNHCERPMTLSKIRQGIERARQLELLSFVCADTIEEVKAVAQLCPDIINPEQTELIGTGKTSGMGYVEKSMQAVKNINSSILVEQAASISSPEQIYQLILAGAEGVGVASGICTAKEPNILAMKMIESVRRAEDTMKSKGKERIMEG